jgi:regulator of PEP synthase PpsR (kinase-PPPase family)
LVSDSTGETVHSLARACLVQFDETEAIEHIWSMVRSRAQIERVTAGIRANPGVVLYTLVNDVLRKPLQDCCRQLKVPAVPVLDPTIGALAVYLDQHPRNLPGQQHVLDHDYFHRVEAMNYAMTHDDGQAPWGLSDADVILVGVSRSSKTPTCVYLANRGVRAANVPVVPGVDLPTELFAVQRPLIVGLINDPERLVALRRTRMNALAADPTTDYTDLEAVKTEVTMLRRLCQERRWPVLDVTRRSIEETSAAILQLLAKRQESEAKPG